MCKQTMYIQTCTNSHVLMGTTRMRQQWCPGRFSSPPQNGLGMRLALYILGAPRLTTTRSSQDEASDRFRAEAILLVHSRSVHSDCSNSTTKNAHFIVKKGHIVQSDAIHSWLPRRKRYPNIRGVPELFN